ncbi:hypothetical protein XENOCAPTIV_018150 [Xenoophorus captivus]|uniref:Uncharacterized protein n=1 Tax=Xenoophorus captivus TaxID=1517983 RepID=A0ABV0QJX0_9TELE
MCGFTVTENLAKPGRQWHNTSEPNITLQPPRCVNEGVFKPVLCLCTSALQQSLWCDRCLHTLLLLNETGHNTPPHPPFCTTKAICHYQLRDRCDQDFNFSFPAATPRALC